MRKTMPNILNQLKNNYKKKYITPLLYKFSRPPIMFDEKQIRLRKQIEKMFEKLDFAEICTDCEGKGVIFKEINMVLKEKPLWNSPFIDAAVDSRAYTSDICLNCCGEGVVFNSKKDKEFAKSGIIVIDNKIFNVVCDVCGKYLDWVQTQYDENPVLVAKCHNIEYQAIAKIFKIETRSRQIDKNNESDNKNI